MTSRAKHSAPHEPTAERFQPPPRTPLAYPDGKFPVFPPRGDMQNPIYLHLPGHMAALSRHFGSPDTIILLICSWSICSTDGPTRLRRIFEKSIRCWY